MRMSCQKKIVIDAREYSSTTGTYMRNLIDNLQEVDKTNKYILLLKSKDIDKCPIRNGNFSVYSCDIPEFGIGEQFRLTYVLYKLRADLVHFGMIQQPFLYFKNKITTVHDLTTLRFVNPDKNRYIFRFKQFIYWLLLHWVVITSKRILVPSRYVGMDLGKFNRFSKNKILLTYEAADAADVSPECFKPLSGKKFILHIGRTLPHKNINRLITAFSIVQKNQSDLFLVLGGNVDNLMREHKKYADLHCVKNIILTDWVSQNQKVWLFKNCGAYVFPSLSEGFGLPGLEAFQFGAPLISSSSTCLPEIYGNAAHYFNPLDVKDIAKKINDVLGDKAFASTIKNKGYERLSKYSWEKMAQETFYAYSSVLNII